VQEQVQQQEQVREPGLKLWLAPEPVSQQVRTGRALSKVWLPAQLAEEPREPPGNLLHSPELLASSSCTLPPQEESSERTLLPDFGV
jgi:hypothetical protein